MSYRSKHSNKISQFTCVKNWNSTNFEQRGNTIYNFTCLSVRLSRSWKLSPRTRGPKNYSGPRVLTSISAQQLPETDVVDAAISKLLLLSFCICSFPITSQSPSSLCFLFVYAAFQSPRKFDDRFWEEWQQGIIDNQADKRTLEVGLKQQPEKTKNL